MLRLRGGAVELHAIVSMLRGFPNFDSIKAEDLVNFSVVGARTAGGEFRPEDGQHLADLLDERGPEFVSALKQAFAAHFAAEVGPMPAAPTATPAAGPAAAPAAAQAPALAVTPEAFRERLLCAADARILAHQERTAPCFTADALNKSGLRKQQARMLDKLIHGMAIKTRTDPMARGPSASQLGDHTPRSRLTDCAPRTPTGPHQLLLARGLEGLLRRGQVARA